MEKKKIRKRTWTQCGYLRAWFALFAVLALFLGIMPENPAQAAVPAKAGVYIYDEAGLLTDSEESQLAGYLQQKRHEAGCGIYVVTVSDTGYGAGDRYLEDFYDLGYDTGQIDTDAVLICIDMKNRYVNVQAYGKAEAKIPDATGEKIIDALFDELQDGDYYRAFRIFAERTEHYMNYVPIYLRAWVQLIAAFVVGGIVVGTMAANSGGTMTVNAGTYLDERYSGIRARRDDYIRTSITKRRKPQESSGGGGGGHTSSGGHSHSSAGRHF